MKRIAPPPILRGPRARWARHVTERLAERRRAALTRLRELYGILPDSMQLAEALAPVLSAPLNLDDDALLLLALDVQKSADRATQAILARARRADAPARLTSTLGLSLWQTQPGLRVLAEGWAQASAGRIRGITERTSGRVVQAVLKAAEGSTLKELEAVMREEFGKGVRQAELAARDQVGKLQAETSRYQMEAAGVTRYTWRTVDDERVREAHRELDGQVFSWSDPPEEGHPGEAPLCRCYAEPILD
jgi:SPP1 gp7 family putative phage head morphogenesis protein